MSVEKVEFELIFDSFLSSIDTNSPHLLLTLAQSDDASSSLNR